ncbi:unnamed protein product [Ceutorhynchus assimilis]|uniref:Lysophospholipid acyltransferase 5 n=1 Tax=Ceutorhynchus assimilis TaxID=467358 RepID=A0A9N9QFE9_9CUCU|nr:unnamed protein product [Ceutorhynchus assimilis]
MTEEAASLGLVGYLAQTVGVTEPAFRLIVGVLLGYPLAQIYRKYIYNQDEQKQCLYFILSGLSIGFWNFGLGLLHCLLSIFVTYAAISCLSGLAMVSVVFGFNFAYLLVGYIYSSTDSYDITWTMPYCVLVLRLIGVTYDVYDGARPKEKLSSDALKSALKEPPTLLQILGHSFFPSAFLVGPQFSMRRFLDFIKGDFHSKGPNGEILPPASTSAALKRMTLGIFYMAFFQFLSFFVSDDTIISDDFAQLNIFKRQFLLGVWGRFTLYKYISVWLLTEGACILFGISYNGEENGVAKWNGVSNIKLWIFESSTEFNHYIMSFNANTNQWVAQHIYKRLKFLNNKYISQGGVLLFLAVWHGLHSGYYVVFLHEFVVMYVERDFQSFVKSNKAVSAFFANPLVKPVCKVLLHMYTFVFMGWSLLPLVYLQFPRYWRAYSNCGYSGFILWYLWPLLYAPLLRKIFKKSHQSQS